MNKIIKNLFWLLLEHGSRLCLALILNGVLARGVGVEQYGLFQYVLGLILTFSAISFICGAEVILPTLVNAEGEKKDTIISNVFLLRLLFCIVAYMALNIYVYFFDYNLLRLSLVLGVGLLFSEAFNVIATWLQAQTNNKPRSIIVILASAIKCFIVYTLYRFELSNILYYSMAWGVEAVFTALGLLYIYRIMNRNAKFIILKEEILFFIRKGFPFFISLLLMYTFLRLDVFILKKYTDLESLSFYTASYQLIAAVITVAPILSISLAPKLVYANGVKYIGVRVIYISLGMLCFSLLAVISLKILSPYIITFIFGTKFSNAIPIFLDLLWVIPFYFFNEGLNIYLLKLNKGWLLAIKWLIIVVLSLIAYLYLIPKYGYQGAVLGICVGYMASILFSLFIMIKLGNINNLSQ